MSEEQATPDSGQQSQEGAQDQQQTTPTTQQESAETLLAGGDERQQQNDDTQGSQSEGAPEKYEFQAPEGKQFDDALIASYSEVARELNMSQESAQKLIDKMGPVIAARQAEQIAAAHEEWAKTARADKEFGGDNLQENLGVAKKGLETFGTPELRQLLNQSGLGNHPEIIRTLLS